MSKKYTAADFANARFAESDRTGNYFIKNPHGEWIDQYGNHGVLLGVMIECGAVPVPTKPQITESRFKDLMAESHSLRPHTIEFWMRELDVEVVPDPEPTDTELIADALLDGFERDEFTLTSSFNVIAASLATRGITAPKEDK